MMKHTYTFLIFLCSIFKSSYPMETPNMPLQDLPIDVLIPIFQRAFLDIQHINLSHKEGTSKDEYKQKDEFLQQKLLGLSATLINLRCLSKHFNTAITTNIIKCLNLNKDTIDMFLIISTQANIPYFMKIAFNKQENSNPKPTITANPNATHKLTGTTPLLAAIDTNSYDLCKFLLENGADVNKHQENRAIMHGGLPAAYETPIHRAVRQRNTKLVSLCIENGAQANTEVNNFKQKSLLSIAVEKNDPNTLTILLDAYSKANYYNKKTNDPDTLTTLDITLNSFDNVKKIGIFTGIMSKLDYAYVRAHDLDKDKDKEVADLLLNIKDKTINKDEYAQLFKDKRTKCKEMLSQAKVHALGLDS